jgi:DNA-binding NarL/FixJ family response regulator
MLTTPDVQVVGETSLPGEVLTELESIDVIVVEEIMLAEMKNDLTHNGNGTLALVVLTNNDEGPLSVLRSLSLRGWSILPMDATTLQLQAAVVAAAQGLITVTGGLADRLYEPRPVTDAIPLGSLNEPLTAREREVLELVSQGLSNKLIARRLQISEHTVKFHISSISTKLGASSRTDAVSRGVRRGLITL